MYMIIDYKQTKMATGRMSSQKTIMKGKLRSYLVRGSKWDHKRKLRQLEQEMKRT